jgi:hypothetical protein
MRLNDVDNLSTDRRGDIEANDKVLIELGKIAVAFPDMNIGADVNEGLGWMTEGFAELFKLKYTLIDVVAVVHGNVTVDGFRAPDLGRNFNDEGVRSRRGRRDTRGRRESRRRNRQRVVGGGRSGGRVDSTLEETEGGIVSRRGKMWNGRGDGENRGGRRRKQIAGTSVVAGRVSGIKVAAGRESKGSGRAGDGEFKVEGTALHGIGAERDDNIQVAKHGKAKNGIDGDVGTKSKGNSDRRAGGVGVRSVITDHGC